MQTIFSEWLICFAITLVFASCTEFKSTPYFRDISDHARDSVMADAVYKDPDISLQMQRILSEGE